MADPMTTNRIISLSIFGVSFVLALFTLVMAIKHKFYKQLLSEFMIYVMISEMLYGLSRFLCLTRKEEKEVLNMNLSVNMIQIFSSVACDICTLLSTLFISLKIIDGILFESKIFSQRMMQLLSRIIIFSLSFGLALISSLVQVYYFADLLSIEKCNVLSCTLSKGVNDYIVYFIIALTFIIMAIVLVAIIYLQISSCRMKSKKLLNTQATSNIDTMQCKLWIYPIVSCGFWAWRFIYQAVAGHSVPAGVIWLYTVTNALRATFYSIVFIFSNNELLRKIKLLFPWEKNKKESGKLQALRSFEEENSTPENFQNETPMMDVDD